MKQIIFSIIVAAAVISCKTKKSEETNINIDSAAYDLDSMEQADIPAPSILASSLLSGFSIKSTATQTDSIDFVLYLNQEEFDKHFELNKNNGDNITRPDFPINYIIGVICKISHFRNSISIDKVEVEGQEISVYINIQKGEKQKSVRTAQVFQIEKRDGIATMQFFVNGKKNKSFFLTGI